MKKKAATPRIKKALIPQAIRNEAENMIANGLTEAVMGWNPGGMGTQLAQVDTLFKNMRWYMVSNMRQPLSQAYVEFGLVQTVVDVPVDDAFRGGVEIISKELSAEEIEELQVVIEQEDDVGTYAQAQKWNRLFGGAGVIYITGQDAKTPLDVDAIKEGDKLNFRAVDMWELYGDKQNIENGTGNLEEIESEFYDYYGQKIHKSRVHVLKGIAAPSFVRPRLRGWGFSVVEALVRSINQYLKATDLTFNILDEFKIDYFKIEGLAATLTQTGGTEKIQKRMQLVNQQKNYQRAVVMDSKDDFIQKQLSFGGISETMIGIRMQVASDLRMPLTKVFGISAEGFSSGEDDIENYNAMVESTVRQKSKYGLIEIIKLRCQQKFGYVPDDITIKFKPLRILGAEQEENVKTQKFARLLQNCQAGLMSVKEYKDAVNKENLLGVQLDTSLDKIETGTTGDTEVKAAPKAPESTTTAPDAKE